MSLSKILLATSAFAAAVQCPADKIVDPEFTLEIMHLQDITEANKEDITAVASTYAYIIEDLIATFPGKVKFGYAEFSDDASPDGNPQFADYQCMKIKRQPTVINSGSEVMQQAIATTPVADYDTYNCGFKAMTLAMNTKPGSLVNWSNSPTSFRILTMNTSGAGKLVFDRLGCPTTEDYQNCPMASALAHFDESIMGDATNTPSLDDMWRVGDDNRVNMSFINIVRPGPKTSTGLTASDWWDNYGDDMMGKAYNINVLKEPSYAEMSKIIFAQAVEAGCIEQGQLAPQAVDAGQSNSVLRNGMREGPMYPQNVPNDNRALDLHLKTPQVPNGFRMPAKRAGHN